MVPSAAHLVLATPQISREELAERTRDLLVEAEAADPATRQRILDDGHASMAGRNPGPPVHASRRGLRGPPASRPYWAGRSLSAIRSEPRLIRRFRCRPSLAYSSATSVIMVGWYARRGQPKNSPQSSGRQWPTLVQQMGALPRAQDLAEELGEPVGAVQQARFASQGYSASSIDAAMSRGLASAPTRATRTSTVRRRG